MAGIQKSLKLLEEKKLTEEDRKYLVLYGNSHKGCMEKDAVNNV